MITIIMMTPKIINKLDIYYWLKYQQNTRITCFNSHLKGHSGMAPGGGQPSLMFTPELVKKPYFSLPSWS